MTSHRPIKANRRIAAKNTGPIVPEGNPRSRCNAGAMASQRTPSSGLWNMARITNSFEAVMIADYDVRSAVKRELVLSACRRARCPMPCSDPTTLATAAAAPLPK